MTFSDKLEYQSAQWWIDYLDRSEAEWFGFYCRYKEMGAYKDAHRVYQEIKRIRKESLKYVGIAARLSYEKYQETHR